MLDIGSFAGDVHWKLPDRAQTSITIQTNQAEEVVTRLLREATDNPHFKPTNKHAYVVDISMGGLAKCIYYCEGSFGIFTLPIDLAI